MSSTIIIPTSSATCSNEDSTVFSSVSSFFSSIFPVAHAEEEEEESEEGEKEDKEDKEGGDDAETEDGDEDEEEEEEDEPEDPMPAIYEECENSKACAPLKHHFEECSKRVEEGKGFEGENCIEEFCMLTRTTPTPTPNLRSSSELQPKHGQTHLTKSLPFLPYHIHNSTLTVHLAHCAQECTAPKLFSKLV